MLEIGRTTYLDALKKDRIKILKDMKFKPISIEEQDDIMCYLQAYEHFDLIEGVTLMEYLDYVVGTLSKERHEYFCKLNEK